MQKAKSTNELLTEMSFLGSQKENTQAQENDCPYRPTHSQSWRVCFCYRLPFFTVLCSAPDTVRSPVPPPHARGGVSAFFPLLVFSPSSSWVSGSSLIKTGCEHLAHLSWQNNSPGASVDLTTFPNQERRSCPSPRKPQHGSHSGKEPLCTVSKPGPPSTPTMPSCCFNT